MAICIGVTEFRSFPLRKRIFQNRLLYKNLIFYRWNKTITSNALFFLNDPKSLPDIWMPQVSTHINVPNKGLKWSYLYEWQIILWQTYDSYWIPHDVNLKRMGHVIIPVQVNIVISLIKIIGTNCITALKKINNLFWWMFTILFTWYEIVYVLHYIFFG